MQKCRNAYLRKSTNPLRKAVAAAAKKAESPETAAATTPRRAQKRPADEAPKETKTPKKPKADAPKDPDAEELTDVEAPKSKATKGGAAAKPTIGIEWTRMRVQARTGLKGAGENKSFRFTDGLQEPAVTEARDWLRSRGISYGSV